MAKRHPKNPRECSRCGGVNDRWMIVAPSGRRYRSCNKCAGRDARPMGERVAVEDPGTIEAMERALGMPVTGRGGRDVRK